MIFRFCTFLREAESELKNWNWKLFENKGELEREGESEREGLLCICIRVFVSYRMKPCNLFLETTD